jgi:hypothetical protein
MLYPPLAAPATLSQQFHQQPSSIDPSSMRSRVSSHSGIFRIFQQPEHGH